MKHGKEVGTRVNHLVIVDTVRCSGQRIFYHCRCDCGRGKMLTPRQLTRKPWSCGCKECGHKPGARESYVDGTSLNAIKRSRKPNSNNTSGCRGVTWSKEKGKWLAQLCFKGRCIHSGLLQRQGQSHRGQGSGGEEILLSRDKEERLCRTLRKWPGQTPWTSPGCDSAMPK